jgi:hypothetical protein
LHVPLIRLQDVEAFLEGSQTDGESSPRILKVEAPIPDSCFALESTNIEESSAIPARGIGVFAVGFGKFDAVDQVFLLRCSPENPRLCRMVRSEQEVGAGEVFRASRRKSFMTPTPLHIPTSQVSPIPDYTHSVFCLKIYGQEKLEVVSTDQSARLLPLVSVLPG